MEIIILKLKTLIHNPDNSKPEKFKHFELISCVMELVCPNCKLIQNQKHEK